MVHDDDKLWARVRSGDADALGLLFERYGKAIYAYKHKLASSHSKDEDFVFATTAGTPDYYKNPVNRGLIPAADKAGLNPDGLPRLGFHDLRHTFGSHLVRSGLDVVRVSRQLGHSRPSVTLDVYSHDFEQAHHSDAVGEKLTAALGGILGN